MDTPLFQVQFPYDFSKLRLLPLRELSAYRMVQNADTCNLTELLVAIVGGQNQIKIADEDPLKRFGGLCGDPASFRVSGSRDNGSETPKRAVLCKDNGSGFRSEWEQPNFVTKIMGVA